MYVDLGDADVDHVDDLSIDDADVDHVDDVDDLHRDLSRVFYIQLVPSFLCCDGVLVVFYTAHLDRDLQ